ncbi:hypothetical protein BDZ89DRAFT_969247 [Hymenopellis radicata]|nr:hypothetical protein BDZ89DRAFT_969247 [Hymenopellis radicata]
MDLSHDARASLLDAFRNHYRTLEGCLRQAFQQGADSNIFDLLNEDVVEFEELVDEHAHIFSSEELGRLRVHIDETFLRWAYGLRSTAGIASFLGVSRNVVRNTLLEYGIAAEQPQPQPLTEYVHRLHQSHNTTQPASNDPIVETDIDDEPIPILSYTGPLTDVSNEDLDTMLLELRSQFTRAGLSMLDGLLRSRGIHIPRTRISCSLARIDPVHRVFDRIRIRRRHYRVAGPNSIWHHDGQHGTSVHNVRIERLWVDVTAQLGATWHSRFTELEIHHGLNINNPHHIWLLQFLFLPIINQQLAFFVEGWNHHRIQIRHGPNRSPVDLFGFDMFVHGVRGDTLPDNEEGLSEEELEVFGVNWEGLQDEVLLAARAHNNNPDEPAGTWLRGGVPEHLNEVTVEAPETPFEGMEELQILQEHLSERVVDDAMVTNAWIVAFSLIRTIYPDFLILTEGYIAVHRQMQLVIQHERRSW